MRSASPWTGEMHCIVDTMAQREVWTVDDPVVPEAVNVWDLFKEDRAIREQTEAREKGERDFHAAMAAQRDEGREEGRQNMRAAAREFLAMGVSREQVAGATHLSIAELEALERA